MSRFAFKVFVFSFYRHNAGFFLFFFFLFFGVVNAGSLLAYHRSLAESLLGSPVTLIIVSACWFLYHAKCTTWCRQFIDSGEGTFLYLLQALPAARQRRLYATVHTALYAPVLAYATTVAAYGCNRGYYGSATAIILFQLLMVALGTTVLYQRINGWLVPPRSFFPAVRWHRPTPFWVYVLYYFVAEKRGLLLSLKALSGALLYIALVWNGDRVENDSFVFFFLLILLTHTAVAFAALRFVEGRLSLWRNLPMPLARRAGLYLFSYAVLLLPELAYGLWQHTPLVPPQLIGAYYGITVAALFFLTAVQYSGHIDTGGYVKVVFALAFVSVFALHACAFAFWGGALLLMGVLLFWSGFYGYDAAAQKEEAS